MGKPRKAPRVPLVVPKESKASRADIEMARELEKQFNQIAKMRTVSDYYGHYRTAHVKLKKPLEVLYRTLPCGDTIVVTLTPEVELSLSLYDGNTNTGYSKHFVTTRYGSGKRGELCVHNGISNIWGLSPKALAMACLNRVVAIAALPAIDGKENWELDGNPSYKYSQYEAPRNKAIKSFYGVEVKRIHNKKEGVTK